MAQEVIVKIKGIQYSEEASGPVEVISSGEKFEKNGKIYIVYDEVIQEEAGGIEELVKNTIKINGNEVDFIKRGSRGTHLVFRPGQNNVTCYSTPYGELTIGIMTSDVDIQESKGKLQLNIRYDLDINNVHVSECLVDMSIEDKKIGE